MVERDIDNLPKNKANFTSLTPLWFLDRAATIFPNRKSLIHGSVEYTWHQTYRRCRQLASALTKNSVTFGSTVSFLLLLSSVYTESIDASSLELVYANYYLVKLLNYDKFDWYGVNT